MKPPLGFSPSDNKSSIEEALIQLANNTNQFMIETKTNFQNQATAIRNLETQVGQIVSILSERIQANFLSTNELNPKEHCSVIILRSGKELEAPLKSGKPKKENKEVNSSPPCPIIEQAEDLQKAQQCR